MVATCDAHYVCQHDADAHEALLAIQTRDVLSNPNRFRFETKEFYLKTGAEMAVALPDYRDAIPVSLEIAARCEGLDLPIGEVKLPRFPCPTAPRRRSTSNGSAARAWRDATPASHRRAQRTGCASSSTSSRRWASPRIS